MRGLRPRHRRRRRRLRSHDGRQRPRHPARHEAPAEADGRPGRRRQHRQRRLDPPHVGTPTGSAYVATKHAVLGITRSAALGHAKQGIRVNCVAPTAITGTPMVDNALANFPAVMEPVISAIPMGRPGRADEVGRAIAWLSSDDAAFISGHSLAIDGAQLAM
ncbi:SDR family oxidoreductase [Nannocystis pusilla]|uniref:Peroxisomal trans-2-enoyl-CoA reductase n=1 Tax=Nannocystis pusilla TaxID=889268 RepID=A0A9X3IYM8_9BACT|nr:SDR family oxidoreductase [Nannocystis pusilla]MCY1007033.1 SDR family oxidoreductase [Nannocystis pusilla]